MTDLALLAADGGLEITSTSLTVTETDPPFEKIAVALDAAYSLNESARWWIGDLIAYAERRWGDDYAQLLEMTRLTERQAERYRYVAQNIAPSHRRENLSFTHHEIVAALPPPDQARLLALAENSGHSTAAFREVVRDHKAFDNPPPEPRQTVVLAPQTSTVDAARGLRTARETLHTVGSTSPEVAETLHIHDAVRGIDQAAKVVRRVDLLEAVLDAARACRETGVTQTHLPDPAVIVPSGPWDTLSDAIDRATEGRTR